MERIRGIFRNVSEQLDAMSARDRNLLALLFSVVVLVFVGIITWSLHGVLEDRASRVILAKENLQSVQELRVELDSLRGRISASEAKMGEFDPAQMGAYMESWAEKAGVGEMLKEVRETATQVVGTFREGVYHVEVKRAPYEGVLKLLYQIETSPYPIKVRDTLLKSVTYRKEKVIDLSLDLVAYTKEGEE